MYRKWRECGSVQTIQQFYTSAYYKNDSCPNFYGANVIPMVVDAISYDGKTQISRRDTETGRPKMKRYRQRNEFHEPSHKSRIKCSLCGEWGVNCRT
jgi:hypothetical protein